MIGSNPLPFFPSASQADSDPYYTYFYLTLSLPRVAACRMHILAARKGVVGERGGWGMEPNTNWVFYVQILSYEEYHHIIPSFYFTTDHPRNEITEISCFFIDKLSSLNFPFSKTALQLFLFCTCFQPIGLLFQTMVGFLWQIFGPMKEQKNSSESQTALWKIQKCDTTLKFDYQYAKIKMWTFSERFSLQIDLVEPQWKIIIQKFGV